MRSDRGFALITVLWLVTMLSAVVGLGLAATRIGQRTTLNRIVLARGRWAAEACLAIAQARWKQARLPDTATVDLGGKTFCDWRVVDPGSHINVNTADRETLEGLGFDSALVERLIAGRPFFGVPVEGLDSLLTVEGPGSVNLSAAAPAVLRALPGMSPEAAERVLGRRSIGRPVSSLDELAGLLSPAGRSRLLARYSELARVATFAPARLIVTAQGWVDREAPRSTIEIVAVPLPERLATVRRRMW